MRIFLVCLLKLITGLPGRLYRWALGSVITYAANLLTLLTFKKAALRLHSAAIRLAPACWRRYYHRAEFLFLHQDCMVEALEDVEVAFSLTKKNPNLYKLRAVIYMALGEHAKAMDDFTELNRTWPGRCEMRYLRGLCLQLLGRPVSALTDFEADLGRNPVSLDSLQGKAECLLSDDRFKEAAETAAWGLKLKPDHEELLTAAVRAHLGLGKAGEALQFANRLIPASNCAAYAYNLRANALEARDETERALKDREQAVKLDPKSPAYWNQLGILYGKVDKPKAAVKCLNKAIKLDPDVAALHLNRGMALEEEGDLIGALADYDAAVRMDDRDPDNYYFRARALLEFDRPDDSERDLDLAIKLTDQDPHCFFLRGKVYEKKKELAKAIQDYTRAIDLDPKCAPAYERRGAVYFDLGDKERARADSTKARQLEGKK
ncbi:MAG: hypothetical protein A2117_01450 [Candidatus Wildermuthbacteria bacterium GWA2_46_15]|uniref:Uncharacterized protein n=1 Tax=Candidatus Wildermuthbacteria bacterium GWA2_46_15 TaxID=1802443 RepID=A0A1G2QS86_9BACT|nr:MAG: hypothetical protein A2117_01450 [Candidatus Wildermuthbacteria bacterium GWA2_46_15]